MWPPATKAHAPTLRRVRPCATMLPCQALHCASCASRLCECPPLMVRVRPGRAQPLQADGTPPPRRSAPLLHALWCALGRPLCLHDAPFRLCNSAGRGACMRHRECTCMRRARRPLHTHRAGRPCDQHEGVHEDDQAVLWGSRTDFSMRSGAERARAQASAWRRLHLHEGALRSTRPRPKKVRCLSLGAQQICMSVSVRAAWCTPCACVNACGVHALCALACTWTCKAPL